jgi:hypothetical protein
MFLCGSKNSNHIAPPSTKTYVFYVPMWFKKFKPPPPVYFIPNALHFVEKAYFCPRKIKKKDFLMKKHIKIIGLAMLVCSVVWASCGGSDTKFMELDRETRFFLDTSASRQINRLAGGLDTACMQQKDALVKKYTDSLLQVRRQEIQQKMMPQ